MSESGRKTSCALFQKETYEYGEVCSRLSFAKPEYMEKYLDITPGSVSVMGLMNDSEKKVRLLIDEDVLSNEYFACHPCINTSSLKLNTKEVLEKFLPAVHHEALLVDLPWVVDE